MAIPLNKFAARCEELAITRGKITRNSSAQPLLYDISRNWRLLLEATRFKAVGTDQWSEKEEAAVEVIISALAYLRRIGCENIEQLLKDTMERHSGHKE